MKRDRGGVFWLPDDDEHFAGLLDISAYQFDSYSIAIKSVPRARVAIDAGAHVGIFSRRFARVFGSVWAFEPCLENYECLVLNTRDFSNVKPIHAALGRTDGERCVVRVDAKQNSGARGIERRDTGEIPVMTIDGLGLPVSLIKIDTEGFEHEVIVGAERTLRDHQPVLIIERPPPDTIQLLQGIGYKQIGETSKDRIFAVPLM